MVKTMASKGLILLSVLVVVSACSRGDDAPNLLNLSQPRAEGPDEFAILPSKPLTIPEDLAALPDPTPGGTNLTDVTPEADVAAALGGNADVLNRPSTDGALVTHATRFGVNPEIRAELAAADVEFRRANTGRVLERLFNVNVYYRAYEPYSLDQHAELERLRSAGIRTSAAPPPQ